MMDPTFVPLVDFFAPETGSQYVAGQTYQVRPGDAVLNGLIPTWEAEGKILASGRLEHPGTLMPGTDDLGFSGTMLDLLEMP